MFQEVDSTCHGRPRPAVRDAGRETRPGYTPVPLPRRRVPASPMRAPAEGGRGRLAQAWGKVRRFLIVHFSPGYVNRMLSRRRGACRRCGACCELLFRCLHLRGVNACSIYSSRYLQCRLFPLDERDVAEVPSGCGFWFEGGATSPDVLPPSSAARPGRPVGPPQRPTLAERE